MDLRGTAGRIYKDEYYILLHTKYERSVLGDFVLVSPIVSVWELSVAMNTRVLI